MENNDMIRIAKEQKAETLRKIIQENRIKL